MSDVVTVSPQETRVEPVKASSPSWFIARINAVSRIIGALLLCIPMFISLDAVSASTALGIEFVLLWIGGVAPWTVCRKSLAGMDRHRRQVLSPCSSTAAPRARSCGRVAGL